MTRRNSSQSGFLSVAGLVAVLAIARGFDAVMAFLRHRNAETLELFSLILWSQVLIAVLLAALLLLLFWLVVIRAPRNAWIAALYLLTGLWIVLAPVIYRAPPLNQWIPDFVFAFVYSASSYTFLAGAFVLVMGLFILILPRWEGRIPE
jgi:hypothetical protein